MNIVALTQYQGKIVGPIAWVLGHIMNWIFIVLDKIGIPSTGLAIILFTIIMYLFLMPLTYKQQKFSKLQARMNPELQAIQAKYKGKKDNDSMLAQQEEIKALYAKYGVSQTGSCVQLLIQLPIMVALYRVIYSMPAYVGQIKDSFYPLVEQLRNTAGASDFLQTLSSASQYSKQFKADAFLSGDVSHIENTFIDVLYKASSADWASLTEKFGNLSDSITSTHTLLNKYNSFLGLNIGDSPTFMVQNAWHNKSFGLFIVALIIPVLSCLTQWISIKLMPQPAQQSNDPNDQAAQMANSMKTMNMMMPLMSLFFTFSFPAGLGIYWIAGAVVRTIQQIFINKHIDKMDIDAEIAKNTEKYNKKLEEMKSTPQMNRFANVNTRTMNSYTSTRSEQEKEEGLKKANDIYQSGKANKKSLLARANMVKEFDQKNN
ncbi:YidC/Oxa1 family membrane protein insertase [Butyrivibrio sp. INlla16]|uniref:YidC/Oxa1 family membrane protein insertase n=1 Tax=Butyrivibrio sp. INlla16 TaxID=1520807 RepID=UPI000892525D|nr:YidC/Oxa1 family membrane protein insertase [Butyrivibrio sp. INlla16]SDB65612.1 YidC/Oxa1 family membrane protein insertase [Butyrivibrio sp. INlla16]